MRLAQVYHLLLLNSAGKTYSGQANSRQANSRQANSLSYKKHAPQELPVGR
jgi:hypothetical protein